jgi:hypothetical protein
MYQREIKDLIADGASYIQFDSILGNAFANLAVRCFTPFQIRKRGDNDGQQQRKV